MHSVFSEDNLIIFSQVAKLRSFSKAAQELCITASAVSFAIKRIENYLGVELFIRTTRTVELTEAGTYFHRKATELLNEFHSIERSIHSISKGQEIKIRICINNLLHTAHHTSHLIAYLKSNFPTCQIIITTEVYNGVWDALLNKNVDIAIGAPGILVDGGGVDYTEIGEIHWHFAVSKHHPLVLSEEPVPESLLRIYPSIFIEDTANDLTKRIGWLLHGQEAIKVPDWETKRQAQILGTGIGFLPDFLIKHDLHAGKLVKKEIKNMRQPSKMLLAVKHNLKGEVSQWIQHAFMKDQLLYKLYQDLLHYSP